MDPVSALPWDPQQRPINERRDNMQHSVREKAITVAIPDACCGGEACAATVEVLSGENKPTTSLLPFGVSDGSSGSNGRGSDGCLSMEDSGTANYAPLQVCGGMIEDQEALMMAMKWHQEGWADGSFIGISSNSIDDSIDISPEDWLDVAEDLTPTSAALDNS